MSPEWKQYERAFEIIEAYGADPSKWPQDERSSIEQCVARAPSYKRNYEYRQPWTHP